MRAELPLDAEDPVVIQLDPDATPILSVMLGGPLSVRELSEIAENMVKDRLERLPGVGSIEIIGSRRREVRIWLDPVRLAGYGLSIDDVRSTLLLENAETAGGRVEGREREWTVTTSGPREAGRGLRRPDRRPARRPPGLYLRDVAKTEDGLAEERSPRPFQRAAGSVAGGPAPQRDEHGGRRRSGSDGSRGPAAQPAARHGGPDHPRHGGVHRGLDLLRLLQHALGRPAGGRRRPPVPAQPEVDPDLGAGDPLLGHRVVHVLLPGGLHAERDDPDGAVPGDRRRDRTTRSSSWR